MICSEGMCPNPADIIINGKAYCPKHGPPSPGLECPQRADGADLSKPGAPVEPPPVEPVDLSAVGLRGLAHMAVEEANRFLSISKAWPAGHQTQVEALTNAHLAAEIASLAVDALNVLRNMKEDPDAT